MGGGGGGGGASLGPMQTHLAALDVCFSSPARTGGSGTLLIVSLFWIVRFSVQYCGSSVAGSSKAWLPQYY